VIDQNPPHQLRSDAEEVRTTRPGCPPLIHEMQVQLVHEGSGIQGMVVALAPELPGGDAEALVVDQRNERVERRTVTLGPASE
jgi:hypothetical protein